MLRGLNDYTIIPAVISNIESRLECNVYNEIETLPLFTAPMSCVIDENNYKIFQENKINTIIPRNIDIDLRLQLWNNTFVAMSLDEFTKYIGYNDYLKDTTFICIDLANGHMKKLLNLCKLAKEKHGSRLQLMTGNIANPQTYLEYAKVGIDYVRLGIGSGNVCTTSANTGVHYPLGSLIRDCVHNKKFLIEILNDYQIDDFYKYPQKHQIKSVPKIIADGGFKNFDQIIKALALGADYCMLGEIFAKSWEACGEIKIDGKQLKICDPAIKDLDYITLMKVYSCQRDYYGMSTKRAQQEFGVIDTEKLKTAEGIVKQVTIDYTLAGWIDNFKHYLKSAMSYTNSRTLKDFKKSQVEIMSQNSFNSFYK